MTTETLSINTWKVRARPIIAWVIVALCLIAGLHTMNNSFKWAEQQGYLNLPDGIDPESLKSTGFPAPADNLKPDPNAIQLPGPPVLPPEDYNGRRAEPRVTNPDMHAEDHFTYNFIFGFIMFMIGVWLGARQVYER